MDPEIKEWIKRRSSAVLKKYTAYECLHENGHGEHLVDPDTSISMFCPFHENVNTPAARYYTASGGRSDYVHCFRCKQSWNAIDLLSKFKHINFMESLKELERRFHIKIPKKPEGVPIEVPKEKNSTYISEAWSDVSRVLKLLESKLIKLRDKIPMVDYIKFCRVLDAVKWDLDKLHGVQNAEMVEVLMKVKNLMEKSELQDYSLS